MEPEKSTPRIETLEPEKVDEEDEGKKDESSCSSEEEDDEDSESETEAGTAGVHHKLRLRSRGQRYCSLLPFDVQIKPSCQHL